MCCSLEVKNLVMAAFVCVHYTIFHSNHYCNQVVLFFKIKFLVQFITELI